MSDRVSAGSPVGLRQVFSVGGGRDVGEDALSRVGGVNPVCVSQ